MHINKTGLMVPCHPSLGKQHWGRTNGEVEAKGTEHSLIGEDNARR